MRTLKIGKMLLSAFVLLVLTTGCGREQAPSPAFPTVIATSPLNGAVAVLLNTSVTATFSSVMAPATINSTTFTLTGPGATAVAGTVTYAGSTATFTPAVSLAASTVYVATITTGATDPGGNPLAANFVWSFTTGLPTVISTVPAAGAAAVPVNTLVSALFTEPMNPLTFSNATFTLTGPGLTPVAGAVTYSGSTATFMPAVVLANSTLYTATITTGAKDNAGISLAANFVWTFTTAAPPTVVSTVPANLATAVAVNTPISATFSGAMDPATITGTTFTLTGPGLTPVAGTVTYAGSTATFAPMAILASSTLFTATITTGAKDPTGAPLAAPFVWTFTSAPAPTVLSTVPANGATAVLNNTPLTATFSVPMDAATINATTFTVTGPGVTAVAGTVTYSGVTATFTPTAPLLGSVLYTASITTGAKDPTENPIAANYVWTFTTALTPAVNSTAPASGAINVPLNQKIAATFNTPMTASTITSSGTFAVKATTGGAAVPGMVSYDAASNTVVFTPTAALTASTQYTATITTAAQSLQGNALAANYVWSFTTGLTANASAPTVTSTIPIDTATGVPLNQRIAPTFSTVMDPSTISAPGTFALAVAGLGGAAVPGTVSYAGRTAIFTPTANLAASTQYTATISTAAKDLTGVAMAANFVWSFTTGLTANVVAPVISTTSPANGAVNVLIDSPVSANFSAAMDPTTITNAAFTLADASGAPVNGTVSYDPASQTATFIPSANLAADTTYTATISPLVTDLSGNPLASGGTANPWSFTTGAVAGAAGPAMINLGTSGNFAVMATASISSTGPVVINGDVGLAPGTSQGIPPAQVNGTIHVNDPVITKAQADLLAAYNDAVSRSTNALTLPGNMGGLTFTPGLYVNSTSVLISGAGPGNNVTLDAQGDPNAVFIFKMGSTLTTGTSSQVILAGGAKAGNIFWQVGTSATIDVSSIFKGNVLAATSITVNTGAAVEGRMFAGAAGGTGSATVNASTITVPTP